MLENMLLDIIEFQQRPFDL